MAEEQQLVTFKLGTEEFGIEIMKVQEIIRVPPITRVPQAPSHIEGVINLRGNVISVVNLRRRFGLPDGGQEEDDVNRIVVLKENKHEFGIRVDAVHEVLQLQNMDLEPPPSVSVGIDASYIRGIGKVDDRLLIFLKLDNVMGGGAGERTSECEFTGR
ncbi:MAG: chemotaxis protein CheW [Peptococcaceae bacterium]|nr:chemotaxis protein CheW [Peptococcaceae bacterium]